MTKDIVELILRKLKELEQTLLFLRKESVNINTQNIKDDMIRYWGVERGIQISIENIIDIANIIISTSDKEKPNTYRETMNLLSEIEVVPKSFSRKLSNMVGFRNILVHDYTKIDPEIIIDILKNGINDFISFANYVNEWLKKNY